MSSTKTFDFNLNQFHETEFKDQETQSPKESPFSLTFLINKSLTDSNHLLGESFEGFQRELSHMNHQIRFLKEKTSQTCREGKSRNGPTIQNPNFFQPIIVGGRIKGCKLN